MGYDYKERRMYGNYDDKEMTVDDLYELLLSMRFNSDDLDDGSVTNSKIADFAVDSAKIAHASIGQVHIQEAAINNAMIQNLAVSRAKIRDAAIGSAQIEDLTVTGAKIANATIDTANIKQGAITTALIATAAIETSQIADASITDAKIVALTATKLTAGTIDTNQITIQDTDSHLVLTGSRLQVFDNQPIPVERVSIGDVNADGTVYGFRVRGADGLTVLYDETGVYNEGITDGAITNPKISDGQVDNRIIAANAITADKIVAGAITAREIASKTITTNEIAANAVTADKIAANAITANKISVVALSAITADLGTVNAGTINGIDINGVNISGSRIVSTSTAYPPWTRTVEIDNGSILVRANSLQNGVNYNNFFATQNGDILLRETGDGSGIAYDYSAKLKLEAGSLAVNLDDGKVLKLSNNNGFVTIGTENVTYAHLKTNSLRFYFNKTIDVDGEIRVYDSSGAFPTKLTGGGVYGNNGIFGNVSGIMRHNTDYLTMYPYNSTYDDGTHARFFYAGKGTSSFAARTIHFSTNVGGVSLSAAGFNQTSLLEKKTNILPFEKSVLDDYRCNLDLYSFDYIDDDDNDQNNIGFVIGEGYRAPEEIMNADKTSASLYNFASYNAKAIKELTEAYDSLVSENESLKERLDQLEATIQ